MMPFILFLNISNLFEGNLVIKLGQKCRKYYLRTKIWGLESERGFYELWYTFSKVLLIYQISREFPICSAKIPTSSFPTHIIKNHFTKVQWLVVLITLPTLILFLPCPFPLTKLFFLV